MNGVTTGDWIQIGLVIAMPILVAIWVDGRLRGERRRDTMAQLQTMLQFSVEIPDSYWLQAIFDAVVALRTGMPGETLGEHEQVLAEGLRLHLVEIADYLIAHGGSQDALDLKAKIDAHPLEGDGILTQATAKELMHEAARIGARITRHTFVIRPDGQAQIGQRWWRRWTGF